MSNTKVSKLRQSILKFNTELSRLKNELETSEFANEQFNKILIQKAICKKSLDDLREGFVQKIFKKFTHKNEKLICDYFKS